MDIKVYKTEFNDGTSFTFAEFPELKEFKGMGLNHREAITNLFTSISNRLDKTLDSETKLLVLALLNKEILLNDSRFDEFGNAISLKSLDETVVYSE